MLFNLNLKTQETSVFIPSLSTNFANDSSMNFIESYIPEDSVSPTKVIGPDERNVTDTNYSLYASNALAHNNWISSYDKEYDWALIVMSEPARDGLGWIGVRAYTPSSCVGKYVTVSGYPRTIENTGIKYRLSIFCWRIHR